MVATGPALGSVAWAETTDGRLTAADRRAFLAPVARQTAAWTLGRLRLLLGLRREDAAAVDLDAFVPPDSRLARDAESEARETLSPYMLNHSYRTFFFGSALASLDGVAVDAEHLWVTALLHDIALEEPDASACFAVRGGRTLRDLALRAGVDEATSRALFEGVAHHITPGVDLARAPLPALVQAGALVDLTGLRLADVRADFVDALLARYPRAGVARELGACWRAEARAFPDGRAAFLEKVFFSRLVGLAPYRD